MKELSIEEKELLLKDLCARLPYEVIIKHKDEHGKSIDARLVGYNGDWFNYYIDDLCFHLKIHEFKPYLRPMSSMTEEEKKELHSICPHSAFNKTNVPGWIIGISGSDYGRISRIDEISKLIDWLNAHHFDYRGLIEKGLALEASEEMYK